MSRGRGNRRIQAVELENDNGDLHLESVDADDRTEIGSEHVERNASIVAEVPGEGDSGHSAFADQSFNGVAVGKGCGERVSRQHPAAECLSI
jgi:hypothetical protein